MHTLRDYYQILGVAPDADAQQIKKAYRALARQYHPDARNSSGLTRVDHSRFIEATEAYRVLINPDRRAQYDFEVRNRWRVLAAEIRERQTPVNPEHLRPFMLFLAGFVGFSFFMLFVFVVILIRYAPQKSTADTMEQAQQAAQQQHQTCEIDFRAGTYGCDRRAAVRFVQEPRTTGALLEIELDHAAYRSIVLSMTLNRAEVVSGWVLDLQAGEGSAQIHVVGGELRIYSGSSTEPLMVVADFAADTDFITLAIRDGQINWRNAKDRGSLESPALFDLAAGESLVIGLNRAIDEPRRSIEPLPVVAAVLTLQLGDGATTGDP